jgi:hypothetical protein
MWGCNGVGIISDKSETINFDFDGMITFEQLEFLWENTVIIKLSPFQWDYCSLVFSGSITDWDPLKEWYSKWFSENPKEGSMLSDCVHFISDPETVENGYQTESIEPSLGFSENHLLYHSFNGSQSVILPENTSEQ